MEINLTSYCQIKNGKIIHNGEVYYEDKENDFQKFIKNVYQFTKMDYRKFYKMDPLCKLSLMSSSILIDNLKEELNPNTALVLTNKSACLDVDLKNQKKIEGEIDRTEELV